VNVPTIDGAQQVQGLPMGTHMPSTSALMDLFGGMCTLARATRPGKPHPRANAQGGAGARRWKLVSCVDDPFHTLISVWDQSDRDPYDEGSHDTYVAGHHTEYHGYKTGADVFVVNQRLKTAAALPRVEQMTCADTKNNVLLNRLDLTLDAPTLASLLPRCGINVEGDINITEHPAVAALVIASATMMTDAGRIGLPLKQFDIWETVTGRGDAKGRDIERKAHGSVSAKTGTAKLGNGRERKALTLTEGGASFDLSIGGEMLNGGEGSLLTGSGTDMRKKLHLKSRMRFRCPRAIDDTALSFGNRPILEVLVNNQGIISISELLIPAATNPDGTVQFRHYPFVTLLSSKISELIGRKNETPPSDESMTDEIWVDSGSEDGKYHQVSSSLSV